MATSTTTGELADLSNVAPPASDTRSARDITYPHELYPEIEPFDTGMLDVGDGAYLSTETVGCGTVVAR